MANPQTVYYIDPSRQTRTSCTITTSSTTATVNQTGHGYSTSDTIKIQGETGNPTVLNGYHVITYVDADNYSYTISDLSGASGTGTILASKMNLSGADGSNEANAYPDLQYTIDTITPNPTNGDRFYMKGGTDEVMVAALANISPWASGDPLDIIGYTTSITDNGVCVIDFGGFKWSLSDGKSLINLECKNGPAADWIIDAGRYCTIWRCYIHDSGGGITMSNQSNVVACCRVEDVGTASHDAIYANGADNQVIGNWILETTGVTLRYGIFVNGNSVICLNNIITMDGGTAIRINSFANVLVTGNTLFSADTGTGTGVHCSAIGSCRDSLIMNNYIEGFSIAFDFDGSSAKSFVWAGNAVYNNTTNSPDNTNENFHDNQDNEVLSVSGIAKSGSNTYALRNTYFEPQEDGAMLNGGLPEAL